MGAGKDSHAAGLGGALLSIKAGRERPGDFCSRPGWPAPGPAFLPGAACYFLLFVLAACLVTGPYCFFPPLSCPLGLGGHCHGRKEGVADQKVQRKVAGEESGKRVALAAVPHYPRVIFGGP